MPTETMPLSPEQLLERLEDAEHQLNQLQDALVHSQRLAAIGTVAAAVAHEFNNLLTPMISYSQYALSGIEKGQPDMVIIEKALRRGATNAEKAGRICSSMLNLSRGSRGGSADLQEIIDEVLAVLARDPSKDGIALRVQVPPDVKLRCDAVQVEQVLLNLLINAKQAMESTGGGRLTVTAEIDGEEFVTVRVTDTGPGIDPRNIERVFEPFFTTKSTGRADKPRGTGLGLAICRRLVQNNGGSIEVSSQLGRGTTFAIRLPVAA